MNRKIPINYLIIAGVIPWIVLVLSGYYIYHKPFSLPQIFILGKAFFQSLTAIILIILAGGMGRKIYTFVIPTCENSPSCQAGIGIGLISILYLLVGTVLGVGFWISLGFLLVLSLVVYKECFRWISNVREVLKKNRPITRYGQSIFIMVGIMFSLAWLCAIAPPLKFDALVYHLTLPKEYITQHKIIYVWWNMFWGMPQLGEMLYTLVSSISGYESAVLLGWSFGLLVILALLELLSRHLQNDASWTGIAVLFSGSTLAESLGWGYVDWITIFYGALFVFILLEKEFRQNKLRLVEAGIFAGLALGVKYTAGILAIIGIVAICWLSIITSFDSQNKQVHDVKTGNKTIFNLMINVGLYGFTILLTFFPWLLKNFLATGQPFYPFFIPAGAMSALRIELYTVQEPWGDIYTRFLLPWYATVQGVEGQAGFGASISPLLLILIPFAWINQIHLSTDRKAMLSLLGIIGLVGWIIWGIGSQLAGLLIQTRLYFAIFPVLIILSSWGFENLMGVNSKYLRFSTVLKSVVILVLSLNTIQTVSNTIGKEAIDYLLGKNTQQEYLQHNLGWYAVAADYLNQLKPNSRVLLLFEPRGFYCSPYCDSDEALDDWFVLSYSNDIPNEPLDILHRLKARNYGYVMVNLTGAHFVQENDPRYSSDQWNMLEELLPSMQLVKDFGNSYALYKIP